MYELGELLKEGKGKRIYATNDPDTAVVYFKDETKAFHGLKRGRILGKGEVNNAICSRIFTMLAEKGVENHFIEQIDKRQSLVRRTEIIPVAIKVRNFCAGNLATRIGLPIGTRLNPPVVECSLKDDDLDNPLINISHVEVLGYATRPEMEQIRQTALEINAILSEYLGQAGIELIDFKLEFGRYHGKIILADEISPDTCRFWDVKTHEPMDLDRFRRDLGDVEEAYQEVLRRIMDLEE